MDLQVRNLSGSQAETITVSPEAFGRAFNEHLVHQVVTAYLAGGRSGTQKQKTRSEVSGGGAKPWRQKGTGRARAGTIRSPIWRGGGKVFAATPRDYSQKVNKKMYRGAMQAILSELIRQNRLTVVDNLTVESPKTKTLLQHLDKLGTREALIVVDKWDTNLYLSARNVPKLAVKHVRTLDPVSLIRYPHVFVTPDVIRKLEEVLA